ncbi:MAG: TrkH family potassium uptake protein, partial [Muribaculaceae bacterium]|nr:TrkH family potassium uptake protein [Muribaculaceae bacterium]
MGKREAILLTGLTWIILSFFGMTPFLFCGVHLSVTDAFFETMSGFTTTGATVLNSFQNVSHSILIWRCIVQWIGGLGIILFTLAVLPMLNYQGGIQLFNAEVTGITHDKLRPRVSFTAQSLWLVYIGLTTFLIFLLSLSRMSVFDAICYGLSTMSTGGFSINDTSVVEQGGIYVKIILTIFMFLGGVNFALIYKLMRGDYKSSLANDALRCYIGIIVISYLLLCLNILIRGLYHDISDITIDPLFQAVSILSSTGLTEPDFRDWGPLAVVVLIVLMFMGACAGST